MIRNRFFTFFLTWFCCSLAIAQETPSDLELWRGITLEYALSDKWDVEFEEQSRFNENVSELKVYFLEGALQYKAADFLDFKFNYRWSNNQKARDERRYSFDTNLEYDIPNNPIDIQYRLRVQDTKVAYTGQKINHIRNKLALNANLSKLVDPFVAFEHFYRIRKRETRTNRYTVGLQWRIEDDLELETYFRRDYERNVEVPNLQYIIGVLVKYNLN